MFLFTWNYLFQAKKVTAAITAYRTITMMAILAPLFWDKSNFMANQF
jgi:hypothetical protein